MSLDLENVCTHTDLAEEVGGEEVLANLLARSQGGSSELARKKALEEVVRALARRAPPIYESDLTDPTELRAAVVYGALTRLYRQAMTTPDSVFAQHAKTYASQYEDELDGLSPTVGGGDSMASAFSFGTERR